MEKLKRIKRQRALKRHARGEAEGSHTAQPHTEHRSSLARRATHLRRGLALLPWGRIGIWAGASTLVLLILGQLLYPADRMPLFSRIDGVDVSWLTKSDAAKRLNNAYAKYPIAIYMTGDAKPVTSPKLSELDAITNSTARVAQLDYPWYLRLVPSSLLWAGFRGVDAPKVTFGAKFQSYVDDKLMASCHQAPVNATLKADDGKIVAVPEIDGRSCEKTDVIASIKKIQPNLARETAVHVGADVQPAAVTTKEAQAVANTVNSRLNGGVQLQVGGESVTVPATDVASWLDFSPHDDTVDVVVNSDRAGDWLNKNVAAKVTVQPGTSYITTRDFTELSRTNGANGQALDVSATLVSLQQVVNGEQQQASVATKVVAPKEQYTRTYSPSDQGLTALMTNYTHDHPGTFGISMIELDGKKRRADYNGSKQFVTASTYKLFAAYELLKQIDAGQRDWDSNATCFNKMISYSDNACAESFLNMLGLSTISKDIQAIGLTNSTFMKSGGPFTTANDLTLLLGMIATGQNFSSTNQQRLIAAMKGNVYRKGIPAGVNGTVADKVGFLDALLHDAAIVYGPHGTYVLAIMTDGSSWATIADLAGQIDALHAQ